MKIFRITKILLAVALGVVLAGCLSLGPDYQAPKWDGPEKWTNYAPAGSPLPDGASWWSVFNDPVLDALEAELLAQNPSLAATVARLDAAAAQLGISRADYYPSLNISSSVTYDRQTGEVHGSSKYPKNPAWLYQPGINFQWELDFWGRVRRNVEAASAEFSASAQDVRSSRLILSATLASTYITLRTLQTRLDYARKNAELQASTLELVSSRNKAGLCGELDVRQAEMNLASTRAKIPSLEAQIDSSLYTIATLVGGYPGSQEALRTVAPIPLPDKSKLPAALPADLLRNRPDVIAAAERFHSAVASIGSAKAEFFPKITINGSFAFSSTSTHSLFRKNAKDYSIGPSIEWPIFTAGRLRNQVRAAQAEARAAEADYRDTVLSAAAECEKALSSHRAALAAIDDLRAAAVAAEQAVKLVESLYRSGNSDFQNVLDMQQELASNQDSLAQGLGSVASALVDVWQAFGTP